MTIAEEYKRVERLLCGSGAWLNDRRPARPRSRADPAGSGADRLQFPCFGFARREAFVVLDCLKEPRL